MLKAPDGMSYEKDRFLFIVMFMVLCGMVLWTTRDTVDGSTLFFVFSFNCMYVHFSASLCVHTTNNSSQAMLVRAVFYHLVASEGLNNFPVGLAKQLSSHLDTLNVVLLIRLSTFLNERKLGCRSQSKDTDVFLYVNS